MAFLEERLPVSVKAGASFADDYNVEIIQSAGGNEYRKLVHPYPVRVFNIGYTHFTDEIWSQILALYHRAYGMFAGFRVRAFDDYTTNTRTLAPTAFDETLEVITTGSVYRLRVSYGAGATPLSIGKPVRTIFKPVSGTTKVGIDALEQSTGWSVDTTTGKVTFAANKLRAITAITQAASAVVTVGAHTFVVGDSVHFSNVLGMTQINGLRGAITAIAATTITVAINSSGFAAYTKGGIAQTNPQTGAVKTGNITAITKAVNAVVTVGTHTFVVSESVLFADVVGMTEINGLTGVITATSATTITVDIDSSAFSTYTSGGTAKTALLTAEVVKGGCEFDIPCRFNSRIDVITASSKVREAGNIELVEILNP